MHPEAGITKSPDHSASRRQNSPDGRPIPSFHTVWDEFDVDLNGYIWDFHHNDEGTLLAPNPLIKSPHQRVQRVPLTAAMLAGFAERGRWDLVYPPYHPKPRYDMWFSPIYILLWLVIAGLVVFSLSR